MDRLCCGKILVVMVILMKGACIFGEEEAGAPFTYVGTEFTFSFPPQKESRKPNTTDNSHYKIDVVATVNFTTTIFVKVVSGEERFLDYRSEIKPGKIHPVSLDETPGNLFDTGNGTIVITATAPVGVVAFIFRIRPSAAFQVIPEHELGCHYVIASHMIARVGESSFAVTSNTDNNVIVIETPAGVNNSDCPVWPGGGQGRILNKHETLFCRGLKDRDITGTQITSLEPLSVVVGGVRQKNEDATANSKKRKGYVMEQMLPVKAWGTEFAIAPFAKVGANDNYELKILTRQGHAVNVTIRAFVNVTIRKTIFQISLVVKGAKDVQGVINENGFFNQVIEILSNDSISVVQSMSGPSGDANQENDDRSASDPSTFNVPAVQHFQSQILVDVFDSELNENLINVVTHCNVEGEGFMIDGKRVGANNRVTTRRIRGTRFCAHVFNLTSGLHCVSHASSNASFYVVLYSWKVAKNSSGRNAYAMHAGLAVGRNYPTCVSKSVKSDTTMATTKQPTVAYADPSALGASLLESDNICGNETLSSSNGAADVARQIEEMALKLAENLVNAGQPSQTLDIGLAVIEVIMIPANASTSVTIPSGIDAGSSQCRTSASIHPTVLHDHQVKALVSVVFRSLGASFDACSSSAKGPSSPPESQSKDVVGSEVLSLNLYPPILSEIILPEPVRMAFPLSNQSLLDAKCAFWNYTSGGWSDEGCVTIRTENSSCVQCSCNHLTNFAVLMQVNDAELSAKHQKITNVITPIGCAMSIMGAVLTIVTFLFLRLKSDRVMIHMNLAIAVGMGQVIFLGLDLPIATQTACTILASLLYYFFMAVFCWMLIEGVNLYMQAVIVFNKPGSRMKIYLIIGWLCPLLPLACTLGFYRGKLGDDVTSLEPDVRPICFVKRHDDSIWFFVVPVLTIILLNLFFISRVIVEIVKLAGGPHVVNDRLTRAKHGVRACIILLPVMGLTWVFGVMWQDQSTIFFMYLFIVFNSLQGLFLFIFHCVLNSEVRNAFGRKREEWRTMSGSKRGSTFSLKPFRTSDNSKNKKQQQSASANRYSSIDANHSNHSADRNHSSKV